MPWTTDNYPPSMKSIKSSAKRERAIHIANAILERTGDEGMAIATAQKRIKSFTKTSTDLSVDYTHTPIKPINKPATIAAGLVGMGLVGYALYRVMSNPNALMPITGALLAAFAGDAALQYARKQ